MSAQPVEAVFFWRYLVGPFRAAYGRIGRRLYTKDYLQCSGEQRNELDRVLHRARRERIEVEFRWPGGSVVGQLRDATDNRSHLAWPTGNAPGHAPLPWKVGNPATTEPIAIPGDPTQTTPAGAEHELATLQQLAVDPWIVAVKLYGEDRVLHTRAYLGAPPAGLESKSTLQLPEVVRDAMERVSQGSGGVVTSSQVRAPELVRRVLEALERESNVLLIGPPGTGKTVALEDVHGLFDGSGSALSFDPDLWTDAWSNIRLDVPSKKVVSLVFHSSYSYEEFVAGLVPTTTGTGFRLVARPGPLLSLAHWASDAGRAGLVVVDEFNRGPAAAIFGDTLALLDKAKRSNLSAGRSGASIAKPHPESEMTVMPQYRNASGTAIASEIRLPDSLWILAALNSTDRSVAPLDAALRRRFAIIRVLPDYQSLARHMGTQVPTATAAFEPSSEDANAWTADDVKQLALRVLIALNNRIEFVLGEDYLLGHAFFWSVVGDNRESVSVALQQAFDEKVSSSLRLTFLDQDEALAAVLNAGSPPLSPGQGTDNKRSVGHWLNPPTSLRGVATPRLQVREIAAMDWTSAAAALKALL